MEQFLNANRPRRREYSKQFKADILAKCAQPGATIGGVALSHGLHSNMVHRWIREAQQARPLHPSPETKPGFISVPLPAALPFDSKATSNAAPSPRAKTVTPMASTISVLVQLQRGDLLVSLNCPLSQCADLLRQVLR
jgi:transposase-like protein